MMRESIAKCCCSSMKASNGAIGFFKDPAFQVDSRVGGQHNFGRARFDGFRFCFREAPDVGYG